MSSPWIRPLGFGLAALMGGLVAAAVANEWALTHWISLCAVALGAGSAGALWAWLDTRRGAVVIDWLQNNADGAAPGKTGFWGELAYRAERALRLREGQAQTQAQRLVQLLDAIEASPNGVLLLDEHDQIEWCSRVAATHLSLNPLGDRGQHITNLVRHPAFVALLHANGPAPMAVFERPDANGSLSVFVRRFGAGSRLVLTQDVTEQERTEVMRRNFVANVSHEIRTPLTVVAGFIQTLQQVPMDEAGRTSVLALMHTQAQRMHALVADLLVLAQLEGGATPPTDHWLRFDALLRQAQATATSLSAGAHELVFATMPSIDVAGNESELISALSNLLSNAVRYTPSGGRITVCAKVGELGQLQVDVIDTGIGVPREHQARLTERFYRVDQSRSRDTGGTGLGLAIVKHVMQRHGGELLVHSEPGRGSTFSLVLPAARLRTPLA